MQAHFNVKRSRIFTVGTAVFIAAALLLSGCSASNQVKPFQMVFCGNPLDASKIESYGANLSSNMPQLTVENQDPVFTPILAGEGLTQEDQITGAAGQTKFTALIAAQEIDVAICTLDTAEIQARNESFMPLDQIFTAEELEQLGDRQLSFQLTELKDGEEVPSRQIPPPVASPLPPMTNLPPSSATSLLGSLWPITAPMPSSPRRSCASWPASNCRCRKGFPRDIADAKGLLYFEAVGMALNAALPFSDSTMDIHPFSHFTRRSFLP